MGNKSESRHGGGGALTREVCGKKYVATDLAPPTTYASIVARSEGIESRLNGLGKRTTLAFCEPRRGAEGVVLRREPMALG